MFSIRAFSYADQRGIPRLKKMGLTYGLSVHKKVNKKGKLVMPWFYIPQNLLGVP
jgi:hypothetical protein